MVTFNTGRERFFGHLAQTSAHPLALEISHAEGIYLYSSQKKYIDCISGISVSNVGHANQKVISAIKTQLDKHLHLMVYGEIIQDVQTELAYTLTQLLPPSLDSVYFVNSGSEAIEGAMKLAKRYTGRHRFVALKNAYHGSTQGALSLMDNAYFSHAFVPLLPGVDFISQNDLEEIESLVNRETAAVFLEPVMGEAGYLPCQIEFLQALRKRCNETGTLLIYDEIQTGFGRTGELFAFNGTGIVPDVLVLAKGFGGGMPLGAFITSVSIMSVLKENPVLGHITTFGGHPLSCAASLAALKVLLEENLMKSVAEKEKLFRSLLNHTAIRKIDGIGMMLAIDLADPVICRKVIDGCVEDGLLIDWFLYAEHKIRLAPPLIISFEQIRTVSGIILENIHKAMQPSVVASV